MLAMHQYAPRDRLGVEVHFKGGDSAGGDGIFTRKRDFTWNFG